MIPDRRVLTTELVAFLAVHTNRPVGDGKAPADTTKPYYIVYPLDGGGFSGSVAFPEEEATFPYQVTSVAEKRDQVEWAADKARKALCGRDPATGVPVAEPVVEGLNLLDIAATSIGRPDKGDGDLWSQADGFTVSVQAVA